MRLWHEELVDKLPRNQLLGQHRECCALRGGGWKKNHSTVNYVFNYHPFLLFKYHCLVMNEMESRGYNVSIEWKNKNYRGKNMPPYNNLEEVKSEQPIYKEHDDIYLKECLENLAEKGIIL